MHRLRPAVHKNVLLIVSGLLWTGVGILLNFLASRWLSDYGIWTDIEIILVGIVAALVIAVFGFSKIAEKNINRILGYKKKVCLFAFQEWKSYILIAFMMTMGIYMRTTGLIPKFLLAPMYIGIGLALFLTSFLYYQSFTKEPVG